jgi:endonuclease/exonuclease/phosphatase (EEP) superfamily protein YafD
MKSIENSDVATRSRPTVEQQAEAANLAAKVAALPHGGSARAPQCHGWLWWICHATLWLVALGLLTAVRFRIFYHDGNHFLTWINAFTLYVYLPAYVCLAWALWKRRWLLTLVSFIVVAFHVGWNLPDFVRDDRFDVPAATNAATDESQTVRIFFANVLATNHDFGPLWQEIENADPDVVVLAECSRFSNSSFRQTPAMADYVHTNGRTRSQIGEVKIYSKLPIKFESQNWIGHRVVQKIDVELGAQTLRVIGIHAPRPQPPDYDYFGYYDKVVPLLTAEPNPVVMIGDFNATQHSLVYKQLKDSGLRSAHEDRGRGYATTWPNGRWLLPPIRIDQAFLSPDVECMNIEEGRGAGSDHKPLILDVALRNVRAPQPAAATAE